MLRIPGMTLSLTLMLALAAHASAPAASLRGSPAAMVQQNRVAKDHGLAFYRTGAAIHSAAERGELVELKGNENYEVANFVRYPFAHPDVQLFVERLSAQYREACGQKLVVTSAVRPSSGQPSNAHALSVHPAGMAIDLRVSNSAACRGWLEAALMSLEQRGVLNGIREFRPPHYHVAVFPDQYRAYAEERIALEEAARVAAERERRTMLEALGGAAGEMLGVSALRSDALGDKGSQRSPLAAGIAALLAIPVGFGILFRRPRRESDVDR